MINKKSLLLFSTTGFIVLVLSTIISVYGLCLQRYFCSRPHDDSLASLLLIFFPLFLFSLITYKMNDGAYSVWFKFSRIWVPLTIILVALAPEYSNSFFPIIKGNVSFFLSFIFALVSLIIVVTKQLELKR